ncbi:Pickpocket 16 [Gryllus bimaculatus]|nr:Pickpocket 16 [Gryllus bimaculatus]
MSAYIIGITWSLYEGNPTLTVIEDSHYNTWNFPFPAVTICGINQLDRDKSAEFVQKLTVLNGMSREEIFEDLRLLPTFFDLDADEDLDHNYTRLQKVLDANNITVKQVMKEISPNCEDMVYRCMWKGRELLSCKKTFKDLKTFEGYCCTFNYVAYPEAELKRLNIDTTPKRVSACGKTTGLSIILRNQLDQYFDTFLASYGFKVMIHSELNYPDENAMEVLVPPGTQTFVGVSPTETYATNEVRDIPVERRHCRFEDEGRVEGMRKYTFNNCVMECRKNLSLQLCGCYAFFYPGAESTKICNMTQLLCLSRNRKRLAALVEVDFSMETSDFRVLPSPCGCLPECVMTRYRIQTTSIPFKPHLRKDLETKFYSNLDPHNHTVLHVFFTDVVGTRYRMSPFLGWLDLLASVGGILSLMLGFSMVCGFEMVYYFSLRVLGELLVRAKRRRAVGGPDRSADDFYGRGAGGGVTYASAVANVVGDEGAAPASVAPLAAAPLQPAIARDAHWRTVYPPAIDTGIARDFLRPPAGHEPRADVADHAPGGPLAQQSLPMRRRRF